MRSRIIQAVLVVAIGFGSGTAYDAWADARDQQVRDFCMRVTSEATGVGVGAAYRRCLANPGGTAQPARIDVRAPALQSAPKTAVTS